MNEELTLQDVMESIDEYITEKVHEKKLSGNEKAKRAARIGIGAVTAAGGAATAAFAVQATKDIKRIKQRISGLENRISAEKAKENPSEKMIEFLETTIDAYQDLLRGYKKRLIKAVGATAAIGIAGAASAAHITKESMDDIPALRLRVYEAAEAGLIDVDEKEIMLDYLNLDNYE